MRSQSLQVWRTKCLYLTQFGVSSRIFPTSTSPAAQHGPSGRARARGAKTELPASLATDILICLITFHCYLTSDPDYFRGADQFPDYFPS